MQEARIRTNTLELVAELDCCIFKIQLGISELITNSFVTSTKWESEWKITWHLTWAGERVLGHVNRWDVSLTSYKYWSNHPGLAKCLAVSVFFFFSLRDVPSNDRGAHGENLVFSLCVADELGWVETFLRTADTDSGPLKHYQSGIEVWDDELWMEVIQLQTWSLLVCASGENIVPHQRDLSNRVNRVTRQVGTCYKSPIALCLQYVKQYHSFLAFGIFTNEYLIITGWLYVDLSTLNHPTLSSFQVVSMGTLKKLIWNNCQSPVSSGFVVSPVDDAGTEFNAFLYLPLGLPNFQYPFDTGERPVLRMMMGTQTRTLVESWAHWKCGHEQMAHWLFWEKWKKMALNTFTRLFPELETVYTSFKIHRQSCSWRHNSTDEHPEWGLWNSAPLYNSIVYITNYTSQAVNKLTHSWWKLSSISEVLIRL